MNTKLKLHFLVLITMLSVPTLALAQGTAFNYQGRLVQNGVSANGLHDFIFTLHDAEVGGNVLGAPLPRNSIMLNAGEFVASLDFGPGIFTGASRWLEVSVRPAGVATFTLLNPRQAISPTPYAIYAAIAGSVADGTVMANQLNTGGIAPTPGQFLSYDGGNFVWSDPGANNIFSLNGNRAYYNLGNVGIGTSTPATKLTVSSPGYGIEQTDGARRIGTYLSESGGWFGTRSANPLNFFVNDGLSSMTISTNGGIGIGTTTPTSKLEIAAQDGLKISGFQPFLTLQDSNAGNARGRIQSAGGGIILEPESYLGGSNPGAAVVIANSGFVGLGTANPGAKLHAETPLANTTAVFGKATGSGGVGVYGESAQFNAVRGLAHNANHGAIVGVHDGGGIAVYGTGATGVHGDGTSVGVYARSTSGTAVHADGNATQSRDKGGFVKAMAYIDPFLPADQYVVRSFNSQPGATITVTRLNPGRYSIDFGFKVDDRFISVTPIHTGGTVAAGPDSATGANSIYVTFGSSSSFEYIDLAFFIFVF